ncbi:MAG TPA: hypothetical protein VHX39_15950 [Acetobacteraceae bacterium]|nr:hypothetical protein [Acetobacteraceae bacterium]
MTAGGVFASLGEGKSVSKTADARHAFRENDTDARIQALEPPLHAAMFEEKSWMIMDDGLARIIKSELSRFHDIRAYRPERQPLDVHIFHCGAIRGVPFLPDQ